MPKQEITYKTRLTTQQVVAHLEDLVASLKEGSVCVRVAKDSLVLGLDEAMPLEFTMNVAKKKDKNRISLEVSWREIEPEEEEPEVMLISSSLPEPEPADHPAAPEATDAVPAEPAEAAAPQPHAPKKKRPAKPKGKPKDADKGKSTAGQAE